MGDFTITPAAAVALSVFVVAFAIFVEVLKTRSACTLVSHTVHTGGEIYTVFDEESESEV